MKALIRKSDNTLAEIVASTTGYDLALYNVVDPPPGIEPRLLVWDGAALVRRPQRPEEVWDDALQNHPLLARLRTSTPATLHTYLQNNVTTLAQARDALEFALTVIRALVDRREL